jgi:DNA polymerase-1
MAITEAQADRFHLYQTIVGDIVDGYSGLPGSGPIFADALLDRAMMVRSYERIISRGPRKGYVVHEWQAQPEPDVPVWGRIVAAYEKAGLTEADALKQARLARILRYDDWDGKSPKLWNPPLH